MLWLIILVMLVILLLWLSIAPLTFLIDTRIPVIEIQWRTIAIASIRFEQDAFWFRLRVFFLRFEWNLSELKAKQRTKKHITQKKRGVRISKFLPKMIRMIESFRVRELELRMVPQDFCLAGKLYPLNFIPTMRRHKISVQFNGDAFLMLRVDSSPWRMAYAWIRK